MTEAPKAPRTVKEAAALPELTRAEWWNSPISALPIDGDAIGVFSTGDGRVWQVVPHGNEWRKMEQPR